MEWEARPPAWSDTVRQGGWPVLLLLFASGAAALGHQILWTRRLVDILGASTDTFSKVVGAFFVGLALGGWWSALHPAHPFQAWRRVAWAELAVAGLALVVLGAVPVSDVLRTLPGADVWIRLALPLVLVTPPAVAMGLVLPAVVAAIPRRPAAVTCYAVNTLGGVAGIGLVVFWGLPAWGLLSTGFFVCALNVAIAVTALVWQRRRRNAAAEPVPASTDGPTLRPRTTDLLAFASGFLVLGLEVTGQHQFAQVTINSHFSSAAVLAVVLLALTGASLLVARVRWPSRRWVLVALGLAAVGAMLEPVTFLILRPGLQIIPYELRAGPYFLAVGGLAFTTLGPAFFAAGLLFPALLKEAGTSRDVARLLALNGVGGWLGAELIPTMTLPALGLWRTALAGGFVYGVLGLLTWWRIRGSGNAAALRTFRAVDSQSVRPAYGPARKPAEQPSGKSAVRWNGITAVAAGLGIGLWVWLMVQAERWPQVSPAPGERVIEVAVAREGVVATVVQNTNDWRMVFNNTYTLGGSRAQAHQERQAHLPLLLHGRPKTVALLGVATGSTLAGAARQTEIEQIEAFELSPVAARFAREHFAPFNRQVFTDPRVQLRIEDARWGITRHSGRYDVVVGDLFLPWRTGEGRLFTQEHFRAVRRSLKPDGLFCQWLPLFQLTRSQFDLIARTFLTEFPGAFVLRGDFYTELPIVGLCGFVDGRRLADVSWADVSAACDRLRAPSAAVTDPLVRHPEGVAMCVVGELPTPPAGPLNTLGNARLEWEAGRNIVGLRAPWFIGVPAAEFLRDQVRAASTSLPESLRTAHDSGQFFLTLEIAAKVNAPVLINLRAQMTNRLPVSLRSDAAADWQTWPMRLKPFPAGP